MNRCLVKHTSVKVMKYESGMEEKLTNMDKLKPKFTTFE